MTELFTEIVERSSFLNFVHKRSIPHLLRCSFWVQRQKDQYVQAQHQSEQGSNGAIAVWIVIAFFQSLLLLSRANREGLELEPKQRLLFLWAIEVFCCFLFFLWSFQDLPALEADSLYQHRKEAQVAEAGAKNGISTERVA